jgi:hypothetical protein
MKKEKLHEQWIIAALIVAGYWQPISAGQSLIERHLDMWQFQRLSATLQAFVHSVQCPDVARMLAGPRQLTVEPQIRSVDCLCFVVCTRLH